MTLHDVPRWHSGLALGNAILDRQHILLYALAGTLHDPAAGDAVARTTAQDILDIAQRHCAAEEYLLTANGYEWTEQHREEHLVGLDKLRELGSEFALGTISRSFLAAAVTDWLTFHVVEIDLPAGEYLRRAPVPTHETPGRDPLGADWT